MGKKGKKGDSTSGCGGKQEVISMAGLEIVSEEKFQHRLEGMTSSTQRRLDNMTSSTSTTCVHCIKERNKGGGDYMNQDTSVATSCAAGGKSRKRRRSNKTKASRMIPRASSPIVVHLEDSIKVSSKNAKSATRDVIAKSPLTLENNVINDVTSKSETSDATRSSTTTESGDSGGKNNSNHSNHQNNNANGNHGSAVHHSNSSKETVVSLNNTQYYSGRAGGPNRHHHNHHHHHHRGCHHLSKNFNAFLSAIERVHQKDPRSTSTKLENLVEFAREKSKKDKFYLNNAMVDYSSASNPAGILSLLPSNILDTMTSSSTRGGRLRHKSHLHLLNDKNVELICNNLNSRKSSLSAGADSEEEGSSWASSTSSSAVSSTSSSSVNSSSEDNESEVGGTVSSASSSCSPSETDELSQEEVRYLTQFVSGFSVTKYDCAPDECPECLAAYYDFVSACTTPSYTSDDTGSDSDDETCPVTVKSAGKVEISVAKLFKRKAKRNSTSSTSSVQRNHKNKHRQRAAVRTPPKGVYVDLEDSDVSLSIEYHLDTRSNYHTNKHYNHHDDSDSNNSGNVHTSSNTSSTSAGTGSTNHHQYHHHHHHHHVTSASSANQSSVPSFWDWFYYPLGTYGWLPYSLPYCLVPMYYLPYQLYSTIPKPIMVPRNTPCLNSQRLCYVPAQEIKNFTASQPPQRPWIPLSHPERNKPIALYTVMCYNVLCDKYATRQLYGYCPSWALNWEYRKKGIIEEIRHYSADIISLQEVETDQFYNFFLPELKRDGYDGIFSPKSRARTMTESERKHVDGCAIFYRTAKFSLIKEHLVEFNQLAMTTADGSHDMLNRVMTKDNIGLAALFETKEAIWENGLPPEGQVNQPILVSTCHVHWDPEFSDVKLIQTMMLMSELKNILDETQTSFRPGSTTQPDVNNIPIILCGDLNSLPNSGVLEFLTTSKVAATHVDFKDMGYDACLQKLTTSDHKDFYTHSFKLTAAYSKDMIPYTNYTYDFKGVIDYILYSRELMRPLGVLGPLDENWFTENKVLGCPHPHIPSDHLPLLVELEMSLPPASGSANSQRSNSSLHNTLSSSVRR